MAMSVPNLPENAPNAPKKYAQNMPDECVKCTEMSTQCLRRKHQSRQDERTQHAEKCPKRAGWIAPNDHANRTESKKIAT